MKRVVWLLCILLISITSCSDSDSNTYTEELVVERSIIINVPRSAQESPFNLSDNEDINTLKSEDIQNVRIDSLSYRLGLVQIAGNTNIASADLSINDIMVGRLSDVSVNEQSGSVYPVRDNTLLNIVEQSLNSGPSFKVDLTGSTTSPFRSGQVRIDVYMNLILTRGN